MGIANGNTALIGAAGLLAVGAWLMLRDSEPIESYTGGLLTDAGQGAAELLDSITGGSMKLSNMAKVTGADVSHPNVRAFLRVIRRGEGTADEAGYRRIFGGQLFSSYADHPRIVVRKNGYTSSAAGAYQALASSWDETARIMGLQDFTPMSQDWFAVGRIAARGALDDVKAGRFDTAIRKVAREWASMPGSPYGQPVISMSTARAVFASAGGIATA